MLENLIGIISFLGLSGNVTHALDRLASNTIAQQQQSASPTSNSPTPPSFNNKQQQQEQQLQNKKRLIAKTELRDSPLSSELLDLLLVVRTIKHFNF